MDFYILVTQLRGDNFSKVLWQLASIFERKKSQEEGGFCGGL